MNVHIDLTCESAELPMKCNDSSEGKKGDDNECQHIVGIVRTGKGGIRSDGYVSIGDAIQIDEFSLPPESQWRGFLPDGFLMQAARSWRFSDDVWSSGGLTDVDGLLDRGTWIATRRFSDSLHDSGTVRVFMLLRTLARSCLRTCCCRPGQRCLTTCSCKRDDQAVALGEDLHDYEVFSRSASWVP